MSNESSDIAEERKIKLQMRDQKYLFELPEKIDSKLSKAENDTIIPLILRFLYSNQDINEIKEELTEKNIFSVISLAHCFGINKLSNYLGEIVKEKFLNRNNCVQIYYESLLVRYLVNYL